MAIPLIRGVVLNSGNSWPGRWTNITDQWQTAALTAAHFATSLVDAGRYRPSRS
jgi:hypothetical protein